LIQQKVQLETLEALNISQNMTNPSLEEYRDSIEVDNQCALM